MVKGPRVITGCYDDAHSFLYLRRILLIKFIIKCIKNVEEISITFLI